MNLKSNAAQHGSVWTVTEIPKRAKRRLRTYFGKNLLKLKMSAIQAVTIRTPEVHMWIVKAAASHSSSWLEWPDQ